MNHVNYYKSIHPTKQVARSHFLIKHPLQQEISPKYLASMNINGHMRENLLIDSIQLERPIYIGIPN